MRWWKSVTWVLYTSMHSIAVFSSSTTTASMFLPRIVDTAVSYFLCVGLHRSTTRPRTPIIRLCKRMSTSLLISSMRTHRETFSVDSSTFPSTLPLSLSATCPRLLARASDKHQSASRLPLPPDALHNKFDQPSLEHEKINVLDFRALGLLVVIFLLWAR